MPVIYRCKKCGFILYDSRHPEKYTNRYYGIPTPSEVAAWYNGRCPRCGKPLSTKPDLFKDIVIGITKPAVLKENPSQRMVNGGRNEGKAPNGGSSNRHEARSSASPSKGQKRENIPPASDEDLESDKK